MATTPHDVGIDALMDTSPEPAVHTSIAAEAGFFLSVVALFAAPFSLTGGASLAAGLLALLVGGVGMVTTSRRYVAGKALVPLSMVLAFVAVVVVGLRYLGLDTAFGDAWVPTLTSWLESLNRMLIS